MYVLGETANPATTSPHPPFYPAVIGRKPVSQNIHVLIPGTCDYVVLHGKRELRPQMELFANMLTLKSGSCPGKVADGIVCQSADFKPGTLSWIILGGLNVITRVGREADEGEPERWKQEMGLASQLLALTMEGGS